MSKKWLAMVVLVGAVVLSMGALPAVRGVISGMVLTIDGEKVNGDVVVIGGVSYVPVKAIADTLGMTVIFNDSARRVQLYSKNFEREFVTTLTEPLANSGKLTLEQLDELRERNCVLIEASGAEGEKRGLGAFINRMGAVVTSFRLIEGAGSISATTRTGDTYDVTILGWDRARDLVVLSLDGFWNLGGLPTASSLPTVGSRAVMLGSPLKQGVSDGLITALPGDENSTLRISAPPSADSLGAPIVNEYGHLVGVVTTPQDENTLLTSAVSSLDILSFFDTIDEKDNPFGTIKYRDGTYTGELRNGLPHGYGIRKFESGNYYFGYFTQGMRGPYGTFVWTTGEKYSGTWDDTTESGRNGFAVIEWADGTRYAGWNTDGHPLWQGLFADRYEVLQSTWNDDGLASSYSISTSFNDGSVTVGLLEGGYWQGTVFTYYPDGSITMKEMIDGEIALGSEVRKLK